MKRKLITIFVIVFLSVPTIHARSFLGETVGSAIGSAIGKSVGKNSSDLENLRKKLNEGLPKVVDENTRFDSVDVIDEPLHITYNYTVVSLDSVNIDKSLFNQLLNRIKNQACSTKDTIALIRKGFTLTWSYRGRDGIFVGQLDVANQDCN